MIKTIVIGTAIGAAATTVGVPGVISYLGFKAGGIAAGSAAASMMSSSAVAGGGGVVAGGVIATLQSIGAAGLGSSALTAVGATGAAIGAAISAILP